MGTPSILYIDDNSDLLNIYSNYIEEWGFEIDIVNSPIKALSMLQAIHYDILLVDYNMPEMSGIDFISEVLKNRKIKTKKVSLFSSMATTPKVQEELKQKIPKLHHTISLVDKSVDSLPELKSFLSNQVRCA